jgi:hypothetical protein
VTNSIPRGSPLFLPVHTVNCVQTLKAKFKTEKDSITRHDVEVDTDVFFLNTANSKATETSTQFAITLKVDQAFYEDAASIVNSVLSPARCSFSGRNLHPRMPLSFTPLLLHLKLLHACGQCHSFRVSTPLTGWHCKLRPNTAGRWENRSIHFLLEWW